MSLPAWERGLKYWAPSCWDRPLWSLPAWERGLKFSGPVYPPCPDRVAPRVGAWVEIQTAKGHGLRQKVAPRVGAWVEMPRKAR